MAVMNMLHRRAAKHIPNVAERSASRRPAGSIGWHTGKRARGNSVHEGHRGNTQRFSSSKGAEQNEIRDHEVGSYPLTFRSDVVGPRRRPSGSLRLARNASKSRRAPSSQDAVLECGVEGMAMGLPKWHLNSAASDYSLNEPRVDLKPGMADAWSGKDPYGMTAFNNAGHYRHDKRNIPPALEHRGENTCGSMHSGNCLRSVFPLKMDLGAARLRVSLRAHAVSARERRPPGALLSEG
jgi:hypothetical protein